MSNVKTALSKIYKGNSLISTFLRSIVSSQLASWIDMGTGFLIFALFKLAPWFCTAIGAVAGGIVNCVVNYKFTFRADGVSWKAVIIKYCMVWTGSIVFNSGGTQLLYQLMNDWTWLETIGFRPDGYYAVARVVVSLLVSWFWNFAMQRSFVYRTTSFDPYAIRMMDFFNPRARRQSDYTPNKD
jgi:putative flippase GtrA